MKNKRTARIGLMTGLALIIFIIEAQIPPIVPIPGIKLGLANIVSLFAVYAMNRKDAFMILTLRIIIGSIFTGGIQAFLYSIVGGLLCYAAIALLSYKMKPNQIWVVSVVGAIAHVSGQIITACVITGRNEVLYYYPILIISAVITGVFTGIATQTVYKHMKKIGRI